LVDESPNSTNVSVDQLESVHPEDLAEILAAIEPSAPALQLPLLAAGGLVKRFGGICAVDGASIEVQKGSITGLIGPNGAGKTTLFNLLSNFIRADQGRVLFDEIGRAHV